MKNEEMRIAEHVAIACACGATVVVIATVLTPKTPGIICFWVGVMFLLTLHPIFVLLPKLTTKKWPRFLAFGAAIALCVALGVFAWPDTEPLSDLSIDQSVIVQPFVVGKPPQLNLDYYNESTHTIRAMIFNGIHVFGTFSSADDVYSTQELMWTEMQKWVLTAVNTDPSIFPPRVKTWTTLTNDNSALTAEQVQNLETKNGKTYVFWVSILFYRDGSGEHELDYCAFAYETQAVHLCRNHNGPTEPIEHKGFSFPRKWGIF